MVSPGHWPGWNRFLRSWRVVPMPAFVFSIGILLGFLPAAAQPAAWECPAPLTETSPVTDAAPGAADMTPVAFPPGGGKLTVFAAASLTDAFEELKTDLEAANPDLAIAYNFGGSQALVTQLKEGARADVFASANTAQMEAAVAAELVGGEPSPFIRNRLAIVTPADNPALIDDAADLGTEGIRLVLAQPEVPAGRYARESVCAMARDAETYGDDFVNQVASNVVSEEEDVRDVLAKVVLGEADAGIVYVSDAVVAGDEVLVIAIPDEVNVVATYPVVVLAYSDAALGSAFIAYLLSRDGQATLAEYGFEPVA